MSRCEGSVEVGAFVWEGVRVEDWAKIFEKRARMLGRGRGGGVDRDSCGEKCDG